MSMNKRYYFLQLPEDFFQSKRIKKLRKLAGGDTFTIIYLKMQLKAMNNSGILCYEEVDTDIAEEIAIDIDEDTDNVRVTMDYLNRCGLLEIRENGDCYLPYAQINVGSVTASTIRSRKCRNEKSVATQHQSNAIATNCNGDIDIDIDKDIYIDINNGDLDSSPNDNDIFEELWKLYPRKKGKGQISKTQKHKIAKIGVEEMSRAIERFKHTMVGKDEQYIMYGSTFFNSGYIDYLDENYEEPSLSQTSALDSLAQRLKRRADS